MLKNDENKYGADWNPPFLLTRVFHASGAVETSGHFQTREAPLEFPGSAPRRAHAALVADGVERDERSVRRTRKTFRYLMHSLAPDRMLTLTYRENMQDYETAAHNLNVFIRRLKRQYPGIVFVAVAEKQQRGAWHWHIALRQWVNVSLVREMWEYGQINIRRKTVKASVGRAASYLSKYLSKAVDMVGRSAYKVVNRKSLTKPTIKKYRLYLKETLEGLPVWVQLQSAFSHLADGSFVKDGFYWRIDYGNESLHYRSTEIRACFGFQGGLQV